jgi:amino acid transporter
MMKLFKKIIAAIIVFLPMVSFAASWFNYNTTGSTRYYGSYGGGSSGGYGGGGLWNLFSIVMGILSQAVIILVAFAVIFFLYGILKYITAGDDEEKRTKMKNVMIYGIVGLFVMVSFWGIVNILINTFQLDTTPYVQVPYFDSSGTSGSGSGSADESWNDLENLYDTGN